MIGYDPQLLLTDQRGCRLWAEGFRDLYRESFPSMLGSFFHSAIDDELIDFEPRYRDDLILYVDSEGEVVDQEVRRVPLDRKLAPFVKPIGRVSSPTMTGRTPSEPEMRRIRYSARCEIVYHDIDMNGIEERVLEMLENKRRVQEAFYRDALFGVPYEPKEPATKQNGRTAAYLQHDKTKQHKRRRK